MNELDPAVRRRVMGGILAGVATVALIVCLLAVPSSNSAKAPETPPAAQNAAPEIPAAPAPKPEEKAAEPEPKPQAAPVEPPVAETPAPQLRTYEVQPGDTLTVISKKMYESDKHAQAIFEANRTVLRSPNLLKVGQKLSIPAVPAAVAPAPAKAAKGSYVVQFGDSLWRIAALYDSARVPEMVDRIVQANQDKLEDPSTPLHVGWELKIPE
jgi:nucleoid-associated protein YgaU